MSKAEEKPNFLVRFIKFIDSIILFSGKNLKRLPISHFLKTRSLFESAFLKTYAAFILQIAGAVKKLNREKITNVHKENIKETPRRLVLKFFEEGILLENSEHLQEEYFLWIKEIPCLPDQLFEVQWHYKNKWSSHYKEWGVPHPIHVRPFKG